MPNEDWMQYRIAILQTLERLEGDITTIKKKLNAQELENTNQKWINRIFLVVISFGGGASSNIILKLLGLL